MEETVKELLELKKSLSKDVKDLQDASNAITHILDYIPIAISNKLNDLNVELRCISSTIELFRKHSDHNWVYNGHGHYYDVYKCTKCGSEKQE